MVRGLLLFVAALPTWSTGRALAAGLDDKAAGELQEAKRLYKTGKYEQAAEVFSHLSAAHPDFPVFARNAGACYYYLQRAEPALSNLRDYLLTQKRITAEDRKEVEGWISEMEKLRDQNAPIPSPTGIPAPAQTSPGASGYGYGPGYPSGPAPAQTGIPTPGVPPQGYPVPAGPQPASPLPGVYGYGQGYPPASEPGQQPYPSQPANPSSSTYPGQSQSAPVADVGVEGATQTQATNNNTAWLVGGLGVAVLVTGGVFTYLSQSAFSDTVKQYNSSKESSGKTYADLAGVCYGLGAAAVVTAAIMMVMKEHHSSSSIALAPVVRPDAVGAVLHYTY
jgi:hypothetical protein